MSTAWEVDAPVIHVVEASAAVTALDLEGEFDIDAAPGIVEHAERVLGAGKHLIVNLSGATFIDSSIVHALFTANEAAESAGRVFVLQFGTHAAVEKVLSITGADKHLPIAPTREQALELIEQRVAQAPVV